MRVNLKFACSQGFLAFAYTWKCGQRSRCTHTVRAHTCVSAVVCVARKPRPCPVGVGTVIIPYIGPAYTKGGGKLGVSIWPPPFPREIQGLPPDFPQPLWPLSLGRILSDVYRRLATPPLSLLLALPLFVPMKWGPAAVPLLPHNNCLKLAPANFLMARRAGAWVGCGGGVLRRVWGGREDAQAPKSQGERG